MREAEITDIPGSRDLERRAVRRSGRSIWMPWRTMNHRPRKFSASPCGRGEVFVVEDHSPS